MLLVRRPPPSWVSKRATTLSMKPEFTAISLFMSLTSRGSIRFNWKAILLSLVSITP